jgi:hypothetical protein
MPFSNYKNLGHILKKFQIAYEELIVNNSEAKKANFQKGRGQCVCYVVH